MEWVPTEQAVGYIGCDAHKSGLFGSNIALVSEIDHRDRNVLFTIAMY